MNKVFFTSPGLNYFQVIVPKVVKFQRRFIRNAPIITRLQPQIELTEENMGGLPEGTKVSMDNGANNK